MKRTVHIFVLSIAVIIVLYGGWKLFSSETPAPPQQEVMTTLPLAEPAVSNSTEQGGTDLITVQGNVMHTQEFLSGEDVVRDPMNSGYYYLGNSFLSQSGSISVGSPPYVIEYISQTQYFNIALLREPIGTARDDMEQYLMSRLGISPEQLCRLNYMVSTPDRVNSQFSGKNLGFSFCPGATKLPQ